MSTLREILQAAPPERLAAWCRDWGVGSAERIPGLAERMSDPDPVARRIRALPAGAERVLRRLVGSGGALPIKGLDARSVSRITSAPLAFRTRSPSGGMTLFLPEVLRESVEAAFRRIDLADVGVGPEASEEKKRRAPRAERTARGDAFLRTASFLAEYAAYHGLARTKDGTLSKRDAAKLARLVRNADEKEIFEALDFARTTGLVTETEDAFEAGPCRAAFLSADPSFQAASVARWAFSDAEAGRIRRDLFLLLREADEAGLAGAALEPLAGRKSGGRPAIANAVRDAACDLVVFGLAERAGDLLSLSPFGRSACGRSASARGSVRHERRITLLANGQILAPRNLAPDIAARLFLWAERRKVDVMEEWALTRDSVGGAAARGGRIDDLLEVLREAAGEVPDSLQVMLTEWAEAAGRLRFYAGPVVLASDEADRAWVREALAQAGLLVEEAGSTMLIRPAAFEEAASALADTPLARVEVRDVPDPADLAEVKRRLDERERKAAPAPVIHRAVFT